MLTNLLIRLLQNTLKQCYKQLVIYPAIQKNVYRKAMLHTLKVVNDDSMFRIVIRLLQYAKAMLQTSSYGSSYIKKLY